jgi:hypothetical protein
MTTESNINSTLQSFVKEMAIILPRGKPLDLTSYFSELNFYESMFTPCSSGNVLITEGSGLLEKIDFKGNYSIRFKLQKSEEDNNFFEFYKEFKIYNITNRQNVSSTAQTYLIHFVNEDFVYSLQQKINQNYTNSYSTIAERILTRNLKVPNSRPSRGKSGINFIYPTEVGKEVIIPNLNPFDSLTWIAKRTTSTKYKAPDFLFFENNKGYNFVPVSYLWEKEPQWTINVKPKNISNDVGSEFFGARSMKVISQFNMLNSIKEGSYAGTFVGFDTYTKTISVQKIDNTFDSNPNHANKNANLSDTKSKDNIDFTKMYDSRVAIYPFALPRTTQAYIKKNSPKAANTVDDPEKYIFQRKSFFANLMQKRIQLTMPGFFGYTCGETITLNVPKFAIKDDEKNTDDTLSGKYIILGVRHIIRYTTHETIIEVATDSTKK